MTASLILQLFISSIILTKYDRKYFTCLNKASMATIFSLVSVLRSLQVKTMRLATRRTQVLRKTGKLQLNNTRISEPTFERSLTSHLSVAKNLNQRVHDKRVSLPSYCHLINNQNIYLQKISK